MPAHQKASRLRRDILLFFVLAYAISWLLWLLIIIFHLSAAPGVSRAGRILYFAGIQGPFLAGFILSLHRSGWPQVRLYYATILRRPVNSIWLLAAVLVPPLVEFAAMLLAHLRGTAVYSQHVFLAPAMGWPMLLLGQLLIVHGEEYGWRGFALPRMEKLRGPLPAALALGVLWALWHLPLFYTAGSWQSGSLLKYVAAITATCVVQAMIFFRANRSTLAAMLFHASLNASQFVLNIIDNNTARLMWGVAGLIAIALMPRPWFGPPRDGGAPEA